MCVETDAESRVGPRIIVRRYTYVHAPGSSTVATAVAEWLKHLKLRLRVDLEKKTLVDYQGKRFACTSFPRDMASPT